MYQTLQFTVPLTPPSVNHTYQPCMYTGKDGYAHRGRKLSKEAKAYREAVALFARGRVMLDAKAYSVRVIVFLGYRQRGDAGNFEKNIGDGLQEAGVFANDSRVKNYNISVDRDWNNPRTEITIEVMSPPQRTKGVTIDNLPAMPERIQKQFGPVVTHGDGSPHESSWRTFARKQYREAQGKSA
jgi:Holliday junction resolvase RusA-like endonuclease